MNNVQFWIWLVIIVVTFLARMWKKKPDDASPSQKPRQPQQRIDDPTKPMTFEELLREIEAAKTSHAKPVPVTAQRHIDYDENIEEEARSLEKTTSYYPAPERTNEIYEKAKREAFFRPSLEETLKLSDTDMRFGQFKGYRQEVQVSPAAAFAKEIKTASGFRKAFIMSEILKTRF